MSACPETAASRASMQMMWRLCAVHGPHPAVVCAVFKMLFVRDTAEAAVLSSLGAMGAVGVARGAQRSWPRKSGQSTPTPPISQLGTCIGLGTARTRCGPIWSDDRR